jgi:hypothetical protein
VSIDLKKLSEPFSPDDIEWRVSRAGLGGRAGIYCRVLAYITARAIQQRLDDVCGPENWRNEQPQIMSINGKSAFAVGISILIARPRTVKEGKTGKDVPFEDEWITKWDTAEPTNIEPAKGGFSGAMKRAGAQWGIGRYLYHLEETNAEVSEQDPHVRGWHYAKLPKDGGVYYWKEPTLPGWALPKEKEAEVSKDQLNALKRDWKAKFAPDSKDPKSLVEGFTRFVESVCGQFPVADSATWTRSALDQCHARIKETTEPGGLSPEIPFEA